MPASTLYLIRSNNLTFAKQEDVLDVFLSGESTIYATVTGVEATNVVTITGASLANGMNITFPTLAGGAGLTTGVGYYAINASGATCQLSYTPGGTAINFTTNITSGTAIVSFEMRVWSVEFRDTFQSSSNGKTEVGAKVSQGIAAAVPGLIDVQTIDITTPNTFTTSISHNSDEVEHVPLRQTLLNRTFWLFDRGASFTPRFLPAEYQEGDIISDNPPGTT